ncbi:MAG: hypothetical protein C5B45_01140 [Chlamydiae bacterium]|nr:MAG: hypothetical protein C5B45_01140 [Chlamydiota bacterium]
MSIPSISDHYPKDLGSPLQESSSWTGKVVTKVYEATNCVVSSINSVAQSILSSCISIGTLGRYKLDDLKDYFLVEGSFEDKNRSNSSSQEDDLEKTNVSAFANTLGEAKSNLKRHESKMSIDSATFRRFRLPHDPSSPYSSLYPSMVDTVKLSTCQKTPKERLAEMEKSATNNGK